jgi:hypothetical protein
MIVLILFVLSLRAAVWCLGWLIWSCLAFAGIALVAAVALICLPLGVSGNVWRSGVRSLRPPAYLIRKSRT